jgi:hypothetical protein
MTMTDFVYQIGAQWSQGPVARRRQARRRIIVAALALIVVAAVLAW